MLVFCLIFTLTVTYSIAGYLTDFHEQGIFIALYIIPVPIYFAMQVFRYSEVTLIRIFVLFTIIAFAMTMLEFYTRNYTNTSPFDFMGYWHSLGSGAEAIDRKIYPFLGNLLRPFGPMGRSHANGVMFSGLATMALVLFRMEKEHRILSFMMLICALAGIYISGAWTAVLCFVPMAFISIFGFRLRNMIVAIIVGFFVTAIFIGITDTQSHGEYLRLGFVSLKVGTGIFWHLSQWKYWVYLIFGQGVSASAHNMEFGTEIGWFGIFAEAGTINIILFTLALVTYVRYCLRLKRAAGDTLCWAGMFYVLTVLAGAVHYRPFFVFPANVLTLAIMGYTAHRYMAYLRRCKMQSVGFEDGSV
ncbi:hypothetical protein ACFL6Y_04295 [Elusimicrobiota bacterium]